MGSQLTKEEIVRQIHFAETEFSSFCSSLSDKQFFFQPAAKWSPAQQVKHLIIATNISRLAYILPKFVIRIVSGTPNRNSRTYDELVAKYHSKLEQGGRASGRFIPKPISENYGKEKLLQEFSRSIDKIAISINKNWDDQKLDQYLAPHPLLGKITLRELGYFTAYHTKHHLKNIKAMTQ